jgi:PTS system mannitol-specific IIC component
MDYVSGRFSGNVAIILINLDEQIQSEHIMSSSKSKMDMSAVKKIIVACDAGMGSSAMGASLLRKKINAAGLNIEVINTAINALPDDVDIVITHEQIIYRARKYAPNAHHISITNLLDKAIYENLVAQLKSAANGSSSNENVAREEDSLEQAPSQVQEMNQGSKGQPTANAKVDMSAVKKIIVACDAGMGSSAMGASLLRKKIKAAGLNIEVTNTAINALPDDVDVVITHEQITYRARKFAPNAHHIPITNLLDKAIYESLVAQLKSAIGEGS